MKRFALGLLLMLSLILPALAVEPDEVLADPALEARARDISAHLRCLVCQNQSIDDSEADLAGDLRVLVRERLKAGDTDEEVYQYIVDRYGEFVLLQPVFAWHTLLLWSAAPAALIVGAIVLFVGARRRRNMPATAKMTRAEKQRLARLNEMED